MSLVLSNNGEFDSLNHILGKVNPPNLVLRLFKNNYTPSQTSVTSDFTEADFTGYSAITLLPSDWSITEGTPSFAETAYKYFTSTANQSVQNIYGYYLTWVGSGRLFYSERFPSGATQITNDDDEIGVAAHFELASSV